MRQYLANLKRAVGEELGVDGFEAVVLTHSHVDHISGVSDVLATWGPMPVYKFQERDEPTELIPHIRYLHDSQVLHTSGASLHALHTPGYPPPSHKADHLCFYLSEENAVFTGDLVMGRGSVPTTQTYLVHYGDYLSSMRKIQDIKADKLYPSHGPTPVDGGKVRGM